jgi:hypothetical protein
VLTRRTERTIQPFTLVNIFCIFFWRARVCCPFLLLMLPILYFERCLDTNPESCRAVASWCATNLVTSGKLKLIYAQSQILVAFSKQDFSLSSIFQTFLMRFRSIRLIKSFFVNKFILSVRFMHVCMCNAIFLIYIFSLCISYMILTCYLFTFFLNFIIFIVHIQTKNKRLIYHTHCSDKIKAIPNSETLCGH